MTIGKKYYNTQGTKRKHLSLPKLGISKEVSRNNLHTGTDTGGVVCWMFFPRTMISNAMFPHYSKISPLLRTAGTLCKESFCTSKKSLKLLTHWCCATHQKSSRPMQPAVPHHILWPFNTL